MQASPNNALHPTALSLRANAAAELGRWAMKKSLLIFLFLSAAWPIVVSAAAETPVEKWEKGVNRMCPIHHVTWLFGDAHADFPYEFNSTLSRLLQSKIRTIADEKEHCSGNLVGFACLMDANLNAYYELNLMKTLSLLVVPM